MSERLYLYEDAFYEVKRSALKNPKPKPKIKIARHVTDVVGSRFGRVLHVGSRQGSQH